MISFTVCIYQIQQKNMCTTRKFAKIFICYYSIIVTFWETVACQNSKCLSECVQLLLLILVTMCQVFMKLGENVGTYVRLIVLKFHYKLHCWYYFIWFYFFFIFCFIAKRQNFVSMGNNDNVPRLWHNRQQYCHASSAWGAR